MSYYEHSNLQDVITHQFFKLNVGLAKLTAFEIRAWMSNYIPHEKMDVIAYCCLISDKPSW